MHEGLTENGKAALQVEDGPQKGDWKRNRDSWVRFEEAKASDWTWNIPENPPIPKGESAGVAGPVSGAMEVDSKRVSLKLKPQECSRW